MSAEEEASEILKRGVAEIKAIMERDGIEIVPIFNIRGRQISSSYSFEKIVKQE